MNLRTLRRRAAKLLQLASNPVYRRGLKLGVAAAIEHEGAMRSTSFATLIDVGANIGQFSLLSRALHPNATIHAFEPLTAMGDRYVAMFAGDTLTTLHRYAAGSIAAKTQINVSQHPDSSSLLPISDRQSEIFPGTQKATVETVEVVRIDDVLANANLLDPILVKLDVQGFELEALKGMPAILERARWIYVEVSFMELYSGQPLASKINFWLWEQGFEMVGIYNPTFSTNGTNVQADILYERMHS